MKKAIIILCGLSLVSFAPGKKITVELTPEQWVEVAQVIEESNAPHSQVKVVQGWIYPQLQQQLKDTTGKK